MPVSFVAQTSIAAGLTRGFAGMIASSAPHHISHGVNTSKQLATLTPTAANATAYTLRIVSGGVSADYTYTSDADGTVAEIIAGLVAAVNAGSQPLTAVNNTTTLLLNADYYTSEFGFTVTSVGAGTIAVVATTAQAAALADGVLVIHDASISSDPKACRLPTVSGDITGAAKVAGIKLADNYSTVRSANADPAPHMVSIMRKGHVYVTVEEAVTADTDCYVRYAAGGNGLGSFGAGAGTSERALLNGAKYLTAAAANGIAAVEINIVGG